MSARTMHTIFGIFIGAALALAATLFLPNLQSSIFDSQNDSPLLLSQSDVSILVPTATNDRDGVHFEGGVPEMRAWGPLTYTVESDGTVWIDDTPAMRKIRVDHEGKIVEVQSYAYGQQPQETYAEDEQLAVDLQEIEARLIQHAQYDGFTVSASNVRYWGTSSGGFQYWQTTETRQDTNGVLRIHTFLYVFNETGNMIAFAEFPTSSQYTYVFYGGAFVDSERDAAYFMTTAPSGIHIQSIDWMRVK